MINELGKFLYRTIQPPDLNSLSYYIEWKDIKYPADELTHKVFSNSFKSIKLLLIIFFIWMAITNIYLNNDSMDNIKEKPFIFLSESVVFALSSIIPLLILMYLRKGDIKHNSDKYVSTFSGLFIAIFIFNFILEISGFWYVLYEHNKEKDNKTNKIEEIVNGDANWIYMTISGIILVFIILCTIVLFTSSVFINMSYSYNNTSIYEHIFINPTITFIIEGIIFSIFNSIPILLIANNRNMMNKITYMNFIFKFITFFILFYLLQYSGLFEVLFEGEREKKLV
jgi:hypothetical protein